MCILICQAAQGANSQCAAIPNSAAPSWRSHRHDVASCCGWCWLSSSHFVGVACHGAAGFHGESGQLLPFTASPLLMCPCVRMGNAVGSAIECVCVCACVCVIFGMILVDTRACFRRRHIETHV
mmetsp:Transcript_95570/g.218894  ORF Transcript_95570/g.218894 Transcript_95570/m.218894 type:complete len:124 (+) Transcript_95570:78-449(+)